MKIKFRKQNGYVAVITVLIVGAVMLGIALSVIGNGINETQVGLSEYKGETALGLVNACASDGLLRLNKTNSIPATITIPEGSCTATINSQSGNSWTVTFSGSFGGYTKNIKIIATRTNLVTINSWNEI